VEMILCGPGRVIGRGFLPTDGAPRERGSTMAQLFGTSSCLRQHFVAKGQQISGNPRGGIGEKRQHIDLGVPEIMSLVRLCGEAFRRQARIFRTRRGLQDVKEVEADRLLDFYGSAVRTVLSDIPDAYIAAVPKVVHVLLLSGEQRLESLTFYPI